MSYAKKNDSEYCVDRDYTEYAGYVQHMFMEPDDECTLAEGICYFCKKTFDGHGKTCRPVQHQSSINFALKRCCPECEEKYLKPADNNAELCNRLGRQFLFERPSYN